MRHLGCAIGFLAAVLLLEVTFVPVNASNSTEIVKLNATSPRNTTSSTNATEVDVESSKKDKRQAQRGYTDVPLDEGFNLNSSPPPPPAFESDRPPYADTLQDIPGNFLGNFQQSGSLDSSIPNLRDIDRSFFASSPPLAISNRNQEIPAAAATTFQARIGEESEDDGGKPIPGEAGRDYPTYATIPKTSFSCKDQQWPGYYADTNARCQVFWICQKNRMDAFLCPNGTLFNQQVFVCDWWFNVDCNASPEFYSRNQYLYAGRGVGIDGKPTGLKSRGAAGSTNVFVQSAAPRPSGVNSNALVNQVQSSNQVSRVATVTSSSNQNQVLSQTQNKQVQVQSSNNFNNGNNNNQQQNKNQQFQQNNNQQFQQNNNQQFQQNNNQQFQQNNNQQNNKQQFQQNNNQQYQQTQSQQQLRFSSNQNQLANRMQKNQGPTIRPPQNSNNNNQLVGGYQNNQLSLNSQGDFDKRGFSSTSQNQQTSQSSNGGSRSASYQGNQNGPSSTSRPETFPSPSSPRPSPSPSPTQRLNVNIDTRSGTQQTSSQFSISSTGRPIISVNTNVPLFGPGSSTYSPAKLIASSQNIFNTSIKATNNKNGPTPATIRNTTPSSREQGLPGFLPPKQSSQAKQSTPSKSDYGLPSFIPGKPAAISSTTTKYGPPGYQGPETTTQINRDYGTPGVTPGAPRGYSSDRGGFGKESRVENSYASSTTSGGHNSLERNYNALEGQRSNQFSNVLGQRENMYSSSRKDTYAEYPYSPSQQKNKQRLLELQSSKGISAVPKDIFAYPHFHGQRSNTYSESDSLSSSYITNNNKHVAVDHSNYSQRKNPFAAHPQAQPVHPSNQLHGQTHIQPQQQLPTHQPQIQHHQIPINQNKFQNHPQPPNQNYVQHQQVQLNQNHAQHQQNQHVHNQQYQQQPQQHIPNNNYQGQNQQFQDPHKNRNFHQQHPQQQQQHYPQQQNFNQQHPVGQQSSQFPQSHTPTPSPPFHQRIVKIPSSDLQLPAQSQNFERQATKDGYTPLHSGGFMSIATTSSPFSKQILKHSVFQQEAKHIQGNSNTAFVTTASPRSYTSTANSINSISSPAPPAVPQYHRQVSLSTTLRPPPLYSTAAPFTNTGTFSKPKPTPYANQNAFLASPTQVPFQTTSPGHRQNPYLPHNHGKRPKSQGLKFSNSIITTTIKYPEGTGNLKVAIPGSGTVSSNILDFSYSATPTSSSAYLPQPSSTTTPYPSITERFKQSVSSSTVRPQTHSSPSPQSYKESLRIGPSARLAGSVVNKSTSSSSAIYVDNSDTAESVSTPVSVSPSASPAVSSVPVSTSNFGLRISSTAKKRMAGAWQNYFGGKETTKDKQN